MRNSYFREFLNSPFIVTVLGGLLLWATSTSWQYIQNKSEIERDALARKYESKQSLLVDFASEFPYTLSLARDYKKREIWLANNRQKPDAKYGDNRSFEDTRLVYETALAKYHQRKPAVAFSAQIRATFEEESTISLANQLSMAVQQLEEAQGKDALREVRVGISRIDDIYQQLIEAMGMELQAEWKTK